MDGNNQNNAKPTIDKEYLKKLAEKIKAEKARKEALGKKSDPTPATPPISSISSKYLDDDDEEIASEKTAIIDLSALSGHAADAKLTIVDGKDSGKNIEITKDEIMAGRSLDNDFVISDISVSRKHFKIKKEGDRFVISDMGSGNGIKVNGSKTTSATLADGDIISVGARQIKFEILNPDLKPKVQAQRVTKQNLQPAYEEDEEPVKKGSSPLILVAIIVILLIGIGGVTYFLLFDNQNTQTKTTAVTVSFGENDKIAIKKLIAAKDLKNAEKAVLTANEKTSGDNPYKPWLNEQLVLIGKEKTNQITFDNAKNIIQKNPEEAEKLLKSIPDSSIFSEEAKNLMTLIPQKKEESNTETKKEEVKTEPKKEEPKAEPKKETPKKEESKAEPKKEAPKKEEPKAEPKKEAPKKEEPKAEPKKEEPKKETKKAEPKPAPEKKAKKAAMSEQEAKELYMKARTMRDDDPEEAKKMLQKIINSIDPESKHYKKAKKLLDEL